jgi:hydroxyacylglutathione hydrolase
MHSLEDRPDLVQRTERMVADDAAADLAADNRPVVVDVRTPTEWNIKHIAGSILIPLNHLVEHLSELPHDKRLLVHCAAGYRSAIAASLLQQHGFDTVVELVGGLAAWEAAGLPLEIKN